MLVIPSVSTGNVPQLAIDLLLATYDFEFSQTLDDEYLHPFVGPLDHPDGTPAPKTGIATAAQSYTKGDITLVQLRAPPLAHSKAKLVASLRDQLAPKGHVLIAGSANAGMRLEHIGETTVTEITNTSRPTQLPGSGFVLDALDVFPDSSALVIHTYEGDNIEGAEHLAKELVTKLGLPVKPFVQPVSWKRVYGKDIPLGVEHGLYT